MEMNRSVLRGRMWSWGVLAIGVGAMFLGCSRLKEGAEVGPMASKLVVHPEGWTTSDSPSFHGADIRAKGWDLVRCQVCHGTDYAGGGSGSSCMKCHPGTPEACNTCHGSKKNPAPPKDMDGHRATSVKGVGAHQAHVTEGPVGRAFDCSACHVTPSALLDPGHLDASLPAEVIWGELAQTKDAAPSWDGASCGEVYCHGAFGKGNQENRPSWTKVGEGQAACGTCHGLPPTEEKHPNIDNCSLCHGKVVDKDGNIIDKTLHINGSPDVGS